MFWGYFFSKMAAKIQDGRRKHEKNSNFGNAPQSLVIWLQQ